MQQNNCVDANLCVGAGEVFESISSKTFRNYFYLLDVIAVFAQLSPHSLGKTFFSITLSAVAMATIPV